MLGHLSTMEAAKNVVSTIVAGLTFDGFQEFWKTAQAEKEEALIQITKVLADTNVRSGIQAVRKIWAAWTAELDAEEAAK
jgi:sulfite reductase alpha subunit-like flavoprotein